MGLYFVYAYILAPPIFCQRQYFDNTNFFFNAYVLSTPIFYQRQYFVDANILQTSIICQCLYIVDANILSTPVFCRRLYFIDANIFSVPRFQQAPIFIVFIANYGAVYICIMIINFFKPSQVSTTRYLSITVSITIKVSYDHTRIV